MGGSPRSGHRPAAALGGSHRRASGKPGRSRGRPGANSTDTRRIAGGQPITGTERVSIALTQAQVDEIVRTTGEAGALSLLLSLVRDPAWKASLTHAEHLQNRRLSHSLLYGLFVLACFPDNRSQLGVMELAQMLEMNSSTTHRYVTTLVVAGLLERDPVTRKYRLATID